MKMKKEFELLPCPFCGNAEAQTISTAAELEECENAEDERKCPAVKSYGVLECQYKAVVCSFNKGGCGGMGPYRGTTEGAVEAWNRRDGKKHTEGAEEE